MNNPGNPSIKGDSVMTQGIIGGMLLMGLVGLEVCQWRIGVPLVIVWVLLMGLGGLLWALALNIFGDDRYADDKRQGSASPDHYDGEERHDRSFRHSNAT
jgi:predicted lipid-binding transport protein (Tim44 family)